MEIIALTSQNELLSKSGHDNPPPDGNDDIY